ncbi:hypothetical protein V1289_004705 [Bradyrhizobium sp. AZCC 2289]
MEISAFFECGGFILRDGAARLLRMRLRDAAYAAPQDEVLYPQDQILNPHGEERVFARLEP